MFKSVKLIFSAIIFAILITGCGPSLEDAKKLGFESVSQMEVAKKAGFKNGEEYAFMKKHGFLTKGDFYKYKEASLLDKTKISAKNTVRELGNDFVEFCFSNSIAWRLYLTNNGRSGEINKEWGGVLETLAKEIISQGTSQDAFSEKTSERATKISLERDPIKNAKKEDNCVEMIIPYFDYTAITERKE